MADDKLKHWMNVWDDAQKKIENQKGDGTQQGVAPPPGPAPSADPATPPAEPAPIESPAAPENSGDAEGGQEG